MSDYNIGLGINTDGLDSGISDAINKMENFADNTKKAGKEIQSTFDKQEIATKKAVQSQKELNSEVLKQIEGVKDLEKWVDELKKTRDETNDKVKVEKYNAEIVKTQKNIDVLIAKINTAEKGVGKLFNSKFSTEAKKELNKVKSDIDGVGKASEKMGGVLKKTFTDVKDESKKAFSSSAKDITKTSKIAKGAGNLIKNAFGGLQTLLVGALIGGAYALYEYVTRLTDAEKGQLAFNEALKDSQVEAVKQISKVEQLVGIARNENATKKEKLLAIKKLNEISPEYLKGITLENVNTKEGIGLINNYVEALNRKAFAQAISNKRTEYATRLIEVESKGLMETTDITKTYTGAIGYYWDEMFGKQNALQEATNNIVKNSEKNKKKEIDGIKAEQKAFDDLVKRKLEAGDLTFTDLIGGVKGGSTKKDISSLAKEKSRLEAELLRLMGALTKEMQRTILDGLNGEEKINEILDRTIEKALNQQTVLLALNKEVGKNVAENKKKIIEDTAKIIIDAEAKAKKEIEKLRKGEDKKDQKNTLGNISESEEVLTLRLGLEIKKEIGESEIEFEKRKQKAILEIQKQTAQEKINFLIASGEAEDSIQILRLKNLIAGLDTKLKVGLEFELDKSLEDKFNNSLKDMFGLDDKQLSEFKNNISQLANSLVDIYVASIDKQIDKKSELIDSYEQNISDIENQIDREISKNKEGNASNIAGLEGKLVKEKELMAKAEREREELMEKERKARKTVAIATLVMNTALQVSNLALAVSRVAGESGVGAFVTVPAIIGLLATVIGGVASIASTPDSSGFFEGGYTGGTSIFEERGAVHGKEFVSTAKTTEKNRDLLEGLHTDNDSLISMGIANLLKGKGISLMDEVPNKFIKNERVINGKIKVSNKSEKYLKNIEKHLGKKQTISERYINAKGEEVVVKGNMKTIYS